ncbi:MAG TPA: hypothetical protein VFE37_20700 [Chloroflexota bacterium]|nr:hypothetical protein [Chloroflexota bacterium]
MDEPTMQELEELQNPENWDWEHPEIHHGRTTTVTEICVRFSSSELRAVAQAARRRELSLTAFIHQAALDAAAGHIVPDKKPAPAQSPPGER